MATSKVFGVTGRGDAASGRPALPGGQVPVQATRPASAGPAGAAADQPVIDGPARACLTLAARAERIPVARAFVRKVLGRCHPCAETAVLLASELVTNSIRHSGSRQLGQTITIVAVVHGSGVRIEVTDCNGPTVPALRTSGEMAEGGRGLQLVQALSSRWGYQRDDSRTTTWFVCSPLTARPARAPVLAGADHPGPQVTGG